MKKWLIIAPAAAAAAAAAIALIKKSGSGAPDKSEGKSAAKPAAGRKKDEFVMKSPQTGSYSFASGYKDAKEITVSLSYDADKHSFGVVSEGYIADSGDSHVAILSTDDFMMQLEYAPYYSGEDFKALADRISAEYRNFAEITLPNVSGFRYSHGTSYCLAFPAADSKADYVLVTVILTGDTSEEEQEKLRSKPELLAILNTLKIEEA